MEKLLTNKELFKYISKAQENIRENGSDYTYSLVDFIKSQKIAHGDMVIGEDVKPHMGGKEIKFGEAVEIDLDNNMKESLVFIEDNARYGLQQEQRGRNK